MTTVLMMRCQNPIVQKVLTHWQLVPPHLNDKEKRVEETKVHLPVAKAINSTQVASAVRGRKERTV